MKYNIANVLTKLPKMKNKANILNLIHDSNCDYVTKEAFNHNYKIKNVYINFKKHYHLFSHNTYLFTSQYPYSLNTLKQAVHDSLIEFVTTNIRELPYGCSTYATGLLVTIVEWGKHCNIPEALIELLDKFGMHNVIQNVLSERHQFRISKGKLGYYFSYKDKSPVPLHEILYIVNRCVYDIYD